MNYHCSLAASWRLPDVRWVVALLGLVAGLTSTASAGDVCEAYTRVYLLKHVPHYSLLRVHIQVQVKLINVRIHVHASKHSCNTYMLVYTHIHCFGPIQL